MGEAILRNRSREERKQHGQFLTPLQVARFMASQLSPISDGMRILEPAAGSGALACAIVEYALQETNLTRLWIEGYETDPDLLVAARDCLQRATDYAANQGVRIHVHLHEADFVWENMPSSRHAHLYHGTLFGAEETSAYDLIIANPPYFKLSSADPRTELLRGHGNGHTNIYTVFMSLCSRMLSQNGRACFIGPRSFCSGVYFSAFRREFFKRVVIESMHLFDSRDDTFKESDVLQENVIVTFRTRKAEDDIENVPETLHLSASQNRADLSASHTSNLVSRKFFLGPDRRTFHFRLPIGELDKHILEAIDSWPRNLKRHGLAVSTGPVVPFRAKSFLLHDIDGVATNGAVPLLWMHNIARQCITWPVHNNKPQALSRDAGKANLLVPIANYVVLRRFSAKEEPRRLIAAPLLVSEFEVYGKTIGLENHLNYIYRPGGELEEVEAIGLAALLNSAVVDRYIRITSGNTQVNAAELRVLPLPPVEAIKDIGTSVMAQGKEPDIDSIVFSAMLKAEYLPIEIPLFRETRITMGKIQEAQSILHDLGLPAAQQNEISALTLLILAQLSEDNHWSDARQKSLRIHDILTEIAARYGREYAENTRETIRRQVIHQFEQAGLVLQNPDELNLPTNSPRTHYALSDLALQTLRQYGTTGWTQAVATFHGQKSTLLEVYRQQREHHLISLRLPSGEEYSLSPGKHNELQAAIIEEFGPRFVPGGQVLYIGDTANKTLLLDEEGIKKIDSH